MIAATKWNNMGETLWNESRRCLATVERRPYLDLRVTSALFFISREAVTNGVLQSRSHINRPTVFSPCEKCRFVLTSTKMYKVSCSSGEVPTVQTMIHLQNENSKNINYNNRGYATMQYRHDNYTYRRPIMFIRTCPMLMYATSKLSLTPVHMVQQTYWRKQAKMRFTYRGVTVPMSWEWDPRAGIEKQWRKSYVSHTYNAASKC